MAENIGGGERYFLTVAECLLNEGHQVDLILQTDFHRDSLGREKLKQKYVKAFNLNLAKLKIINGPFGRANSWWKRFQFTRAYDVFYYMTDGSFFIPGARCNVVHFMIPFKTPKGGWLNQLKLNFWPIKTANSFFSKKILEKNWGIKIDYVHWGAVNKQDFKPLAKKEIILNVGRFFSNSGGKHCKRQDILVEVFKIMCDRGLKGWQLILNGPIDKGEDNLSYARMVAQIAKGYPITIRHEGEFDKVQQNYGQASIYWHATGYGLDENEFPEAMEHLGMSTIEAMAAGAVPVVIRKAGQREIVTEGENGLFWETKEELIEETLQAMRDKKLWQKLSINAQKRADDFSKDKFCQMTKKMFGLSKD